MLSSSPDFNNKIRYYSEGYGQIEPVRQPDEIPDKNSKILVVDDEMSLQQLVQQQFKKKVQTEEFQFIFATNGENALEVLRSEGDVDVVLTDINMPEMDGLTLLRKINEIDENIKTIVLSASNDLAEIRKAMNYGAFDFISKPIDFQDLEVTLNNTLTFAKNNRHKKLHHQKIKANLVYNALHDLLTHLPNRSWFISLLEHHIKLAIRNQNYIYAVLFIDLDRFKIINDTLGHSIGDRLLKGVAKRLSSSIRSVDTVARFGGDEFVILLEEVKDIHDVIRVAQRIQEQLASPFHLENYEVYTGASIGIALSTIGYQNSEEVLRDADAAMYRAKRLGRGGYAVFDPEMQASAMERLQLEESLRTALERQEFCLHYQPILALKNGRLHSFEVLMRWDSIAKGMISPVKFIPLAEETGLITPLGWWVFRQACRQLHKWQKDLGHTELMLNLNLSSIQLKQANFIQKIKDILEETQLEGQCLQLELNESYLLNNVKGQVNLLNQLKELGIKLCIDDFGTGYSALSCLNEFPIDTLKLDRKFVQKIDKNREVFETVKMIISLAHSLEMNVIAEGIENLDQLKKLQALGCHYGQGYFLSQPLQAEAAHLFLQPDYSFEMLSSSKRVND
ncbi:MAG: EAL domain-containing protein [Microcoleaceae cyanobacterium]